MHLPLAMISMAVSPPTALRVKSARNRLCKGCSPEVLRRVSSSLASASGVTSILN
jgi:hypothetical protein